jgi:pimeloyl-ACP methyl ester carboxylesterase
VALRGRDPNAAAKERSARDNRNSLTSSYPVGTAVASAIGVLAAAAFVNWRLSKKAERDNPPQGRFLEIDGVRVHYVERGSGRPLVLFHGNGSMIQDFESAGLIDLAARNYRVIAFDRPGFGHSSRPRNVVWSPEVQADLFMKALTRLNVHQAIVLGHSWGTLVALALARRHPSLVQSLVLASGYYFPTVRADVVAQSGPAIPVVGDLFAYSLAPLLSRLMWSANLAKMFGPRPVPAKFRGFPKELAVRPSQIRAAAAEAMLMIPAAFSASPSYGELALPVVIVAGEDDRLVDIDEHSARLHRELKNSKLRRVPGAGHMVHQSATMHIMDVINEAAAELQQRS